MTTYQAIILTLGLLAFLAYTQSFQMGTSWRQRGGWIVVSLLSVVAIIVVTVIDLAIQGTR